MQNPSTIALLLAAAAVIAGFIMIRVRRRGVHGNESPVRQAAVDTEIETPISSDIPYRSEATEDVSAQFWKLAFGVNRFDYQIFADHARVVDLVEEALHDVAEQQQYFPRRPLLLPKLLRALNDTESTRQELVQLILEDPAVAGSTLKRANNAFYRMSAQPVESLERAIVVLGTDGLRSLLSTAVLQPVFRLPKGFFDSFAEIAWEQAQRSAACAQTYAAANDHDDPFIAQLLGIVRSLATLVLFRVTLDKYRACPNVLPRAEVFIRILQAHRHTMAVEIARTWRLSAASIEALEEQCRESSPAHMTSLGQAVYYGELTAAVTVVTHHDLYSPEGARAILVAQGVAADLADKMLEAAQSADLHP